MDSVQNEPMQVLCLDWCSLIRSWTDDPNWSKLINFWNAD